MRPAPFALERYFAKYEFNTPFLLSSSDSEAWSIQEILDLEPESESQLKQVWLGYTESQGLPALRETIAQHLYTKVRADNVVVHSGAGEGIYTFMSSMLEAGDHVVVHAPCYQSLSEIPKSIGCKVSLWSTSQENGWELDIELLEESLRPNTKLIVINCPHNPTGYLISPQKFSQVVEIARARKIMLFSDEVYRYSEHEASTRLPAVCDIYENGVSLGVMSKTFGLAGLRIGWVCTQRQDIVARMLEYKDYLTICNSAPSEFLSLIALRNKEILIERNVSLMKTNLQLLNMFFEKYSDVFSWCPPKAGAIGFPLLKGEKNIDAFCKELLDKKGVFLLPGSTYQLGDGHFRIGFGRKNFSAGLAHFDSFLSSK